MSRAVLALSALLLFPNSAQAQDPQLSGPVDTPAKKRVDRSKADKKKKCPEPVEGEEIVVCAEIDNGEDQLIFGDQRKRESSGASQNANAAACIAGTGCRIPPTGGSSFGKRRPLAIPIEEVYRGLPEPDMVVPKEGPVPDTEPAPEY
jgi:hypothetical protein